MGAAWGSSSPMVRCRSLSKCLLLPSAALSGDALRFLGMWALPSRVLPFSVSSIAEDKNLSRGKMRLFRSYPEIPHPLSPPLLTGEGAEKDHLGDTPRAPSA